MKPKFFDLGVLEDSTNRKFSRVVSDPAPGQYAFDEMKGEYTFNDADNHRFLRLSYFKNTKWKRVMLFKRRPIT